MWHFSVTFPGFTLMPGCRYGNKAKLWQVSSYRCNLPYFLLYVHWNPDNPRIVWDVVLIRAGLARLPVINPIGEPNTPLAFRRRDECHLKQQAGHGKITVGIGHNTINSISFVANYNICFMHIVSAEESDRTLTKLWFEVIVMAGAKTHHVKQG